jgi:hypothetical protein
MVALWDASTRSLIKIYETFRAAYSLHYGTTETSVTSYQAKGRNISEYSLS